MPPPSSSSPDAVIESIARRQHGVVSIQQLLGAGLDRSLIHRRARRGLLPRVHWGIYRLTHVNTPRTRAFAAHRASGPDSFVSHFMAAFLRGLLPVPAPVSPVDVMMPGRGHRRIPGIRRRQHFSLGVPDHSLVDGIPTASIIRIIVDLAPLVAFRTLEQILGHAEREGLVEVEEMIRVISSLPHRRGVRRLGLLLGKGSRDLTRSEAEVQLTVVIDMAGLEKPTMNARIGPFEVDALWEDLRLIVEVDGYKYHSSRRSFEADRKRDRELTVRGYRVLRFTWKQVAHEDEIPRTIALLARFVPLANERFEPKKHKPRPAP